MIIEESLKSKKDKLEKVYTKVIYIYKQKEDEMLPSEKKIFKEFIEKIDNLKVKALKAKDNKDAEVFYDEALKELKPYSKNTTFLKIIKDIGLGTLTGYLISSLASIPLYFSLKNDLNNSTDYPNISLRSFLLSLGTITAGVVGGVKATKEINHKARKHYIEKHFDY